MNEKLEQQLYSRYPKLFARASSPETVSAMHWGICCGDGWYNLIEAACRLIQHHVDRQTKLKKEASQVEFEQIKEKFGELRLYTNHTNDEYVTGVLQMAELLSGVTCESCGSPGTVQTLPNGHWMTCYCNVCRQRIIDSRQNDSSP